MYSKVPDVSKAALEDHLAAIPVKRPLRIHFQQSLAETLFATGYNENQVTEDDISLIDLRDSDCDIKGKAAYLFCLSQACSKMLTVKLIQVSQIPDDQTRVELPSPYPYFGRELSESCTRTASENWLLYNLKR